MARSRTIVSGFVTFSFLLAQVPMAPSGALAGTGTAAGINQAIGAGQSLFDQYMKPNQMNLTAPSQLIQQKLRACEDSTKIDLANKTVKDGMDIVGRLSKKNASSVPGVCGDFSKAFSGNACLGKPCSKPTGLTSEPTARMYCKAGTLSVIGNEVSSVGGGEKKEGQLDLLTNKAANWAEYLALRAECGSKDYDEFKKNQDIYVCQTQVLEEGVSLASTQLQGVLSKNGEQFGKMVQYQGEVQDQIRQVDEILGPDPELGKSGATQFQGLLGIQKDLTEKLAVMTTEENNFKTGAQKLVQDTTANEQTLEAEKISVVAGCLRGDRNLGVSGARSLTCYKPKMTSVGKPGDTAGGMVEARDRNGNVIYDKQPCGTYEYIRSKIEQAALVQNGNIINSQERREKGQDSAAHFDALVDTLNRQFGVYDEKLEGGRLETRSLSWADIEKKLGSNINEISSISGVNVGGILRSAAKHCFAESNVWKKQQMRSSASRYNKRKQELDSARSEMAARIDNGMAMMNKSYSDTMSILGDKHVTLNRFTCTKDDPVKMQECFSQIRNNLQDLLEGDSSKTWTAKTINGGTMVQGFSVACQGINGCVTNFKLVRDKQKTHLVAAKQATAKFVNEGNAQVQSQLQTFARDLANTQSAILKQYDKMKSSLAALQVAAPDRPKVMKPEALKPGEGPDKTPGPFTQPQSMAAALSGMVQPGGLIDFQDSGLGDIMKDAGEKLSEKKTAAKEKATQASEVAAKYAALGSECESVNADVKKRAESITASFDDCSKIKQSCGNSVLDQGKWTALSEAFRALRFKNDNKNADKIDEILGSFSGDEKCENMKLLCLAAAENKVKSIYSAEHPSVTSGSSTTAKDGLPGTGESDTHE